MTKLLSVAAMVSLALTACGVSQGPVEDLQGKGDGFYFTRGPLEPRSTAGKLGTTFEDQFSPGRDANVADHYVAYEVVVEEASTLFAAHRFSYPAQVGRGIMQAFGSNQTLEQMYGLRMILFKLDEQAPATADPLARWDAIYAFEDCHNWAYDVMPGTYMILISVNDRAYRDEMRSFTDISVKELDAAQLPPTHASKVRVTVVTDIGVPAAEMRVALGTASATTDANGVALLDNVEVGTLLGKFGPAGTARGAPESVYVHSQLEQPHLVFTISHADYLAMLLAR